MTRVFILSPFRNTRPSFKAVVPAVRVRTRTGEQVPIVFSNCNITQECFVMHVWTNDAAFCSTKWIYKVLCTHLNIACIPHQRKMKIENAMLHGWMHGCDQFAKRRNIRYNITSCVNRCVSGCVSGCVVASSFSGDDDDGDDAGMIFPWAW
jgi:hypothetical protein